MTKVLLEVEVVVLGVGGGGRKQTADEREAAD